MCDPPPADPLTFLCDQADAGSRLDAVLARYLNVSNNEARRILGRASVRVDGRRVTQRDKGRVVHLRASIEVANLVRDDDAVPIAEPDAALDMLAEHEGLLIVNKPAGMAVHPLLPGETGTVLNAAVARWPAMIGVGERGLRSGVVHRLDVETSGVLAVATTEDAWRRGRTAIESHTAIKRYHVLVHGRLEGSGREVMHLVIAQHKPAKVRVVTDLPHAPAGTRQCDLQWRVVELLPAHTLVEVELGTGFLHQIRVMLAAIGHPVMGDRLYGRDEDAATRQMLHAYELTIDTLGAQAPYPPDFAQALDALRANA